jgi:hypothetical protein
LAAHHLMRRDDSQDQRTRWWLAPASLLALAACAGGDDQAEAPASTTAVVSTTVAPATTESPTTTEAPATLAPPTNESTSTAVAPTVTPRPVPTEPPVIPSTDPSVAPAVSRHRWPTIVSQRKILDQFGDPYLMRIFSSWGMAQNLTNSEITDALEALEARGFNAVNVAPNGVGIQADWVKYENVAGKDFFTGMPFATSLGPAWATMDHIISEAQRLGMTVLFSFFVSYGTSGIGPDLTAVSNENAYHYGVAVASRYLTAPNVVWHVEADAGWQPEDPIGRRLDNLFRGVADTERTPRLVLAEPYLGGTGYQLFISEEGTGRSAYEWLHLSTNAVYDYGNNAVEQFDAVWDEPGATAYPVWDSEPPYASATHYTGNYRQQLRERNYTTFIRGGCGINYGDEDWWRFGKLGLFDGGLEWFEVPDSATTADAQYAWSLIGAHVTDPTWTRDTGAFVTSGLGTGDTKAASGYSGSSGLVYKPHSSSITVDLSIFTDDTVHVRWYDPTTGDYTRVGNFATTGTRVFSHPGDNASGQPDWVLVVEGVAP